MEQEYCIRQAVLEDRDRIADFFSREWKKSQTINDSRLFAYYYVYDNELNFVVAVRKDEIVGACGFIEASGRDVWISNLLVKKGESPTLVLQIIKFFEDKGLNFCGVGIERNTQGFYKILGYEIGELRHYYKLFDREEYKVATITEKQIYTNMSDQYRVISIDSEQMLFDRIDESVFSRHRPRKSYEYVMKRYFYFPYRHYQYKLWAIEISAGKVSTLFVTREQEVSTQDGIRKVLRIVDIIGSETELLGIGRFFEEQGRINGYEYIDCWCYGIDENIMKELGFIHNKANIIPDRLEPLEKNNEEIVFFNGNYPDFRAFRADGDRDRPNIWYHESLNEVAE